MGSFQRICEAMQRFNESDMDPRVEQIFRKKDKQFWMDLADLARSGKDSLAFFLNVPESQVFDWPAKIKQVIERVEVKDRDDKRNQSLPTGIELGDVERSTVSGERPDVKGAFLP